VAVENLWTPKSIMQMGVPSVIALWFVWWITAQVKPSLDSIDRELRAHIDQQMRATEQTNTIIRILTITCANQAQTREDRDKCY
jgi:hypothetical protein